MRKPLRESGIQIWSYIQAETLSREVGYMGLMCRGEVRDGHKALGSISPDVVLKIMDEITKQENTAREERQTLSHGNLNIKSRVGREEVPMETKTEWLVKMGEN